MTRGLDGRLFVREVYEVMNAHIGDLTNQECLPGAVQRSSEPRVVKWRVGFVANVDPEIGPGLERAFCRLLDEFGESWIKVVERMCATAVQILMLPTFECFCQLDGRLVPRTVRLQNT
jgi:hypothetical protein